MDLESKFQELLQGLSPALAAPTYATGNFCRLQNCKS